MVRVRALRGNHPLRGAGCASCPADCTAQQTIAWQAQNSKGTHGQLLNTEARKLDDLIADLEQGRSVDPREIDRALDQSERGSF